MHQIPQTQAIPETPKIAATMGAHAVMHLPVNALLNALPPRAGPPDAEAAVPAATENIAAQMPAVLAAKHPVP